MPSELTRLVGRREEEACVAFSKEVGLLGFERTRKRFWVRLHEHTADSVDTLLVHGESPLHDDAKTSLRAALDGRSSAEACALSKKELGLNRRGTTS